MAHGCKGCGAAFGLVSYVLARQSQSVSYGGAGRTPDDRARLHPMGMAAIARFCSSGCAEPKLAALLERQGVPPGAVHPNLGGGPVYPCALCAAPVYLGAAHVAWVLACVSRSRVGGRWAQMPDWMDMKAVCCDACAGVAQAAAVARRGRRVGKSLRRGVTACVE